jgi:Zn-dependent protease with chaperone function
MATDFYQRQSEARRNTKWLVVMFVLAVIGIVGTTMLATAIAIGMQQRPDVRRGGFAQRQDQWQPVAVAGVAALGIIIGGSLFKIAQLARGGSVVAERLGGRRVYPNTTDPAERRLLNVVEEMALASGVPVPAVFILNEERGINAFAAGHTPSDAVVGVTRGCVQQLTRDQLQGVIAHEFSHVLNGDMRLDLRLMGVLYGILLMGLLGRELLRIGFYSGGGNRRNSGNSGMYLLAIGVVFMVLGFVGSFFGNLIKAAVSRQREFLADASAVQFTRNPDGICGALKRIGSAVYGSKLVAPRAAEASHMYFATGVANLFATHPPLDERIRRIEPQWDGKYPPPLASDAVAGIEAEGAEGFVGGAAAAAVPDVYDMPVPLPTVRHAAQQVANPTQVHQTYVQQLLAAIPAPLLDAAHEPYGARSLIFALLLDENADVRAAQLGALEKVANPHVFELTLQLAKPVNQLDVRALLPLVDMALPSLRALSQSQYVEFTKCFMQLVQADKRLSLFEWTLHHVLLRHLRPQFEKVRPPQVVYYGLQQLGRQISLLLSALSHASQSDDDAAFAAGAQQLPEVSLERLPTNSYNLGDLDQALRDLSQSAPKLRERLVNACAACICADARANVDECELLRAVCDMLNCPMPPIVAGQEVSPSLFTSREVSGVS